MGTLIFILGTLVVGILAVRLSTRRHERPRLRERNADEPLGNRIIEPIQKILDRR